MTTTKISQRTRTRTRLRLLDLRDEDANDLANQDGRVDEERVQTLVVNAIPVQKSASAIGTHSVQEDVGHNDREQRQTRQDLAHDASFELNENQRRKEQSTEEQIKQKKRRGE